VRVNDVARKKVISCGPNTSMPMIAKMMLDNWIGSVVVVENDKPKGIVTDGVIFKLIAEGKNPTIFFARDVMVTPVHTVHKDTNVADISDDDFLRSKVNRLVVVDDQGKLVGVVSRKVIERFMKYSVARRIAEERT
jgi:CBS domain-containing protein